MRTVLWDLDGTVADTEDLHLRAWQETLVPYGVTYDYDAFIAGFGRSNRAILVEMFRCPPTDPVVDEVSRRKEQNFRRLMAQADLQTLPGVQEWLARFRQAEVRQAISSSGPMANVAATIAKLEVGDYFLSLMSGATLPRGKPDPALFLNSAAAVGVPPAACIVVEDSIHGIAAARRAGMGSIAVGKLAHSHGLSDLLAATPGPACLSMPQLTGLEWSHCEELWASADEHTHARESIRRDA